MHQAQLHASGQGGRASKAFPEKMSKMSDKELEEGDRRPIPQQVASQPHRNTNGESGQIAACE